MQLRNHPLVCHEGVHSWPPTWNWLGDGWHRHPKGEVGVLKEVKTAALAPMNHIFLVMEYKGSTYVGHLGIDEYPFCYRITELLQQHCGESLELIGGLEISDAR